jgi:hypothetical protein
MIVSAWLWTSSSMEVATVTVLDGQVDGIAELACPYRRHVAPIRASRPSVMPMKKSLPIRPKSMPRAGAAARVAGLAPGAPPKWYRAMLDVEGLPSSVASRMASSANGRPSSLAFTAKNQPAILLFAMHCRNGSSIVRAASIASSRSSEDQRIVPAYTRVITRT